MRNVALRLMYDGTNYHGWQVQKNEVTVAETLEKALTKICKAPIKLTGCGRTDAGVHALNYCANFRTDATIPTDRIPLAINALIPPDIAVLDAVEAPDDFNAILSCKRKEYTYMIYNARIRNPMYVNRAYFCPVHLDLTAMKEAAAAFCGTRDFAAVRSVGTDVKTTVRTVYYCEVSKEGNLIELKVCADGFLYNMARAITGTVIYAGLEKILPGDINKILESADRRLAGPTVPPQGLYLTKLWYDGVVGRMMDKKL